MISVDPDQQGYWAYWNGQRLQECGQWPCFQCQDENLVIEDQVIINGFTRDPASIIKLAHAAGAIAAEFGYPLQPERVKWVKPSSWKRNTRKPKKASQWASYAIHRLVIEALDPREIAIYTVSLASLAEGLRHNLADAVGIGLHELGRLPQPRTESPRRAARMAAFRETLKRQAS
jgi:hypothetical protein